KDGTPYPATECSFLAATRNGQGYHGTDELLWRAGGASPSAGVSGGPPRPRGRGTGAAGAVCDIVWRPQRTDTRRAAAEGTGGEESRGIAEGSERGSGSGERREKRFLGEYEPRNPHADERHPGYDGADVGNRLDDGAARVFVDGEEFRRVAAAIAERFAGFFE